MMESPDFTKQEIAGDKFDQYPYSGKGELLGSAIRELPNGMTELDLDFPLLIEHAPIHLKEIVGEHRVNCPDCRGAVLLLKPDDAEVPGGGYWLSDGDTIVGLVGELVRTGLERKPSITDGKQCLENYDGELLVGDCRNCGHEYFVLQVKMIDDAAEIDEEFVQRYFCENLPAPPRTNMLAQFPERHMEWIAYRDDTPQGVLLTHVFGPFSLSGSSLRGEYGVAACGGRHDQFNAWEFGRDFVVDLWPSLKELSISINARRQISEQGVKSEQCEQ